MLGQDKTGNFKLFHLGLNFQNIPIFWVKLPWTVVSMFAIL